MTTTRHPNCDRCSSLATLWGMINTNTPGAGDTDTRRKVNACATHRALLRGARETGTYTAKEN